MADDGGEPDGEGQPDAGPDPGEVLLDRRYRLDAPIAEGVFLREYRGVDLRDGGAVAIWLPHREVAPAFEDIEAEIEAAASGAWPTGCRRVRDRGSRVAYVVGAAMDHVGPRPRRLPQPREVVAGWFRAVAGIIDRNHQAGRWHGLLTCDDVAILDGNLVVAGFGFWVRTDPEAIAAALAAEDGAGVRGLCAPEVAVSAIGPAADLWALGRCTLALATGAGDGPDRPDTPGALAALRRRHPQLAEALDGLLAEDPDARVSDLRALADLVTHALRTPYREEQPASARPQVVPVFPPELEDDTATARYEPATGVWTGGELAALAIPTPLAPQAWSPLTPHQVPALQVISMKEASTRGRAPDAARKPARVAPVIRSLEVVRPRPPSAAALGTIAPPRARTQPVVRQRRWAGPLLIVTLALLALGLAAALLWGLSWRH